MSKPRFQGGKWQPRRMGLDASSNLGGEEMHLPLRLADGSLYRPLKMREYTKTSTIFASVINEEFEVVTLEGVMSGKAGDYLAVGSSGELYPIDNEILSESYAPLRNADKRKGEEDLTKGTVARLALFGVAYLIALVLAVLAGEIVLALVSLGLLAALLLWPPKED